MALRQSGRGRQPAHLDETVARDRCRRSDANRERGLRGGLCGHRGSNADDRPIQCLRCRAGCLHQAQRTRQSDRDEQAERKQTSLTRCGWCRISHRFPPDARQFCVEPRLLDVQSRERWRRSAKARAVSNHLSRLGGRHVSRGIDASARVEPLKHFVFAQKISLKASETLDEQNGEEPVCLRHSASPTHRRDAFHAPQSLTQVPRSQSTTVACHPQLLSAWAATSHSKNQTRCGQRARKQACEARTQSRDRDELGRGVLTTTSSRPGRLCSHYGFMPAGATVAFFSPIASR
jgi:hypothetical protein